MYAVEESIESRIHIYKLNSFMEVAKQNKYDIPESIKEQIERSIKLGKELKKTLNSKLPIDKLQTRREQLQ